MKEGINKPARAEVIRALKQRYESATKREKTTILDEFVAVAHCHRKHAIRLLGNCDATAKSSVLIASRRIYDEAVREALIITWEAADRICGKRLKAILPTLVDAMERHGHLELDPSVRERVLRVSAATIDRLLAPVRSEAGRRRRRRAKKKISHLIPTRTFSDWDSPAPGYLGIDSDNDSAFINETLLGYCQRRQIEFTRSRAYRKNDQAWIEQKNGAVIRRFVGYERYCGSVAGQALAHLYALVRLYVNFFQPSFKLLEKTQNGAKVTKRYDQPATPCDRLLAHPSVNAGVKEALRAQRVRLDPVALLHRIREAQAALAALASPQLAVDPRNESLDHFLSQLPTLWRLGENRPTHARRAVKSHYWRTRKDPFAGVWSKVLLWLQQEPDATAKSLFQRLQTDYPGRFTDGQLRTLQRRVKEWRAIMARELVYACLDKEELHEITIT